MTQDLIGRIAGVMLALAILGGMVNRLWRGWKMLFGNPKSDLDQWSDETDYIQRQADKNHEI